MPVQAKPPSCPVCLSACGPRHFIDVDGASYFACDICQARFLDPDRLPDRMTEHSHYLLHENDPDDAGYRAFLSKLADPLIEKLTTPSSGLDYGCGPGPALAHMLRDAGHCVALFDPIFRPDHTVLEQSYDFVTCTETAEHFHDPAREFARLDALVVPGGWIALMTCFQTDDKRFANWHYRKDPTHVVFYREATLRWLANRYGWRCEIPCKDVALMQKHAA